MKKPSNRKERIDFIIRKKGKRISDIFIKMTDREVKNFFDKNYPIIKNKEDSTNKDETVQCIRCKCDVEHHLECDCGIDRCVFTEEEWKDDIEYGNYSNLKNTDKDFIKNGYKIKGE